jgi:ABC-2 type transport system ATP-binding protein
MGTQKGFLFEQVTRRYGPVLGLNDVTLEVGAGITGLIGPNGAGKTTFLNLAVGLHSPSSGRVTLLGKNPFLTPEIRGRVGYCPDGERAWDWMTGREFVVTLGQWCGLSRDQATSRAKGLLDGLEMGQAADKPIASYSRGMRQKVKVAQAMVHRPDLLVLDEPLNGVDPLSRHHILQLLVQEAKRGTSVLISSHVLHELDGFVDEVILLQRGRLLASGTIHSIRELLDEHPHSVRLVADGARALGKALVALKGTVSVTFPDGDTLLEVKTRKPSELYGALPQITQESGVLVRELYPTDNDLESVFKYLVKGGGG